LSFDAFAQCRAVLGFLSLPSVPPFFILRRRTLPSAGRVAFVKCTAPSVSAACRALPGLRRVSRSPDENMPPRCFVLYGMFHVFFPLWLASLLCSLRLRPIRAAFFLSCDFSFASRRDSLGPSASWLPSAERPPSRSFLFPPRVLVWGVKGPLASFRLDDSF